MRLAVSVHSPPEAAHRPYRAPTEPRPPPIAPSGQNNRQPAASQPASPSERQHHQPVAPPRRPPSPPGAAAAAAPSSYYKVVVSPGEIKRRGSFNLNFSAVCIGKQYLFAVAREWHSNAIQYRREIDDLATQTNPSRLGRYGTRAMSKASRASQKRCLNEDTLLKFPMDSRDLDSEGRDRKSSSEYKLTTCRARLGDPIRNSNAKRPS